MRRQPQWKSRFQQHRGRPTPSPTARAIIARPMPALEAATEGAVSASAAEGAVSTVRLPPVLSMAKGDVSWAVILDCSVAALMPVIDAVSSAANGASTFGKMNSMLTLAAVMSTVEPGGAPATKPNARAAACSSALRSVGEKSSGVPAAVKVTVTWASTRPGEGGGG